MIEQLIKILNESKLDGYKIINTETTANEFFFIGHKLDINRRKDVNHSLLTIYKALEDNKFLGSASQEIHPNQSAQEIKAIIAKLVYSAGFVKNPYYHLATPKEVSLIVAPKIDALQVATDIIDVVYNIKEFQDQNINSYEVFVNERKVRIINSNHVDVNYETLDSQIEIIINARKDGHEIEIYRNFTAGNCDRAYLSEEINRTLMVGRDRTSASNTPNLKKHRVLLSGTNVVKLLSYYVDLTNVGNVYMQISDYKIGEAIFNDSVGDKITLTAVASLPNSSKNAPYDEDGNPLSDRVLITNNICKDYWGNEQFSQYVNKSEAGSYRNFVFGAGKQSQETFKQEAYLHAVEFSDFQCDSATGNFAGEIRLAYYYNGKEEIPVTGGSIAGNIKDIEQKMLLSSELKQYDNYMIPEFICLEDVAVTGIE